MTSKCCHHERRGVIPAHKRMRREQPQNNRTTQRSIISIAAIVSSREGALPAHCIHVSQVLEKQAHSGLMTSNCCTHERSFATPVYKRIRREQPQNNATQHHQHCSHREQQRREDMDCSAQGVLLHALHVHRPCISNDV